MKARSMLRRPKILFSSPYIPNPKSSVRGDGIDFFYYRNTIGQKIFQLRQMQSWHPLHFLAQNLPVDSVVIENPTMRAFQREVEKGHYDVVAFSFTVISTARIIGMVSWLKENHPRIEIILGGYGTSIFNNSSKAALQLSARTDHICCGEGLSFMQAYLKNRWGIDERLPMRQSFIPTRISLFRTKFPLSQQLCFLYSLGCQYNCVFCATSSQFGKRKIEILSPAELYRLIKEQATIHPHIDNAIIYDEDFLAHRAKVLEFMQYMDNDKELKERPFLLTVFSSVRSISQYTLLELLRCGIGIIFIGVESFRQDILDRETPGKRTGADISELFKRFHDVGIHTLGSMIVGWDGHTPDNIQSDTDDFLSLNPTLYQVMPLQALPGSPLWARMKAEGRLASYASYEGCGVTKSTFHYKNFTHEEVLSRIDETHRKLVSEGGPSVFKMFENLFYGSRNLSKMKEPECRMRARAYKKMMPKLFVLAFISGLLFYGKGFRVRWRKVMHDVLREHPLRAVAGSIISLLLFPVLTVYCFLGSMRHLLSLHGDQPETIRREYLRDVGFNGEAPK